MKKSTLIRIIIFYLIGISISNIFRFDLLDLDATIERMPVWSIAIFAPLGAIGLFIGAIISIRLIRKDRPTEYSLFGTSKKWSIIMSIIPVAILTIIGVHSSREANIHYYGLFAGIGTFIYCIFEEIGWRAYLQEELKMMKEWQRTLLIGFLWYLWHLTFLTESSLAENIFFLSMLIFGSWGIGKIMELTKSVFAASCFHLIIQIMMFNALIKNGINGNEKLIILGISVIAWIVILKKWKKENRVAHPVTNK